ncbi:MAG: hypothetical protein GY820_17610, partial [Gammaproteobacteria bacterium]|nr:hypothetical protein [Gammaproteobacteria bacterium]
YGETKMDKELLHRFEMAMNRKEGHRFKIPGRNPFIPTKFNLLPELGEEEKAAIPMDMNGKFSLPRVVRDEKFVRLWYKGDDEFSLPKSVVQFHLNSPAAHADPTRACLAYMFVACLEDALTEYTYDAHLAGLSEGFENGKYGLKLSVGGFGEKQRQFISELVGKMADFEPDEWRFDFFFFFFPLPISFLSLSHLHRTRDPKRKQQKRITPTKEAKKPVRHSQRCQQP